MRPGERGRRRSRKYALCFLLGLSQTGSELSLVGQRPSSGALSHREGDFKGNDIVPIC